MGETKLVFGDDKSIAERDRANGMQAAVAHADHEISMWSEKAYGFLQMFLLWNGKGEFLAEDVRSFASRRGLPAPPSERAWGSVISRASRRGLIKFTGYAKTTNPRAHRTPAALWVKN